MARVRDWCFTINNWTDEEAEQLREIFQRPSVRYGVFGREVGEKCGTPHLQCYVYFKDNKTFTAVRTLLPSRAANIEARYDNSTPGSAAQYCKEDGDFEEFGQLPKQGARNDIVAVREVIKTGGGMKAATENCTSYQSLQVAKEYLKYHERKRDFKTEVTWIWGPTGVGKSRHAWELAGGEQNAYPGPADSPKWWEGYDADEVVVLEDLRPGYCSFDYFLRLTDRYPHRVECKGGSRQFLAKKLFITSSMSPAQFFEGVQEDVNQALRRIENILEYR